MAETLVSKVAEGGRLVLTGILTEQAEEVRTEYQRRGVKLIGTKTDGEWILLDFEK
jgi:ribosomal protein L11 methyltransferase